jgi:hypothetical protein
MTVFETEKSIIENIKTNSDFVAKYFPRKKVYVIKYKQNGRVCSGEECLKQFKGVYEKMKLNNLYWSYFELIINVLDKNIEISCPVEFV